jgi:hypothetical protein
MDHGFVRRPINIDRLRIRACDCLSKTILTNFPSRRCGRPAMCNFASSSYAEQGRQLALTRTDPAAEISIYITFLFVPSGPPMVALLRFALVVCFLPAKREFSLTRSRSPRLIVFWCR